MGCNRQPIPQLEWKFIPPSTPNFGGLWEAGVKAVKNPLNSDVGGLTFTYEQYATLLAQIEAILTSRPLFLESTDPNEIGASTPGHFLIGGPFTALPNQDLTQMCLLAA